MGPPAVPAGAAVPPAVVTPAATGYQGIVPARLFESRANQTTVDGGFAASGKLGAGQSQSFGVLGRGGVPSAGVGAVVLTVTAIKPSDATALTVFPAGGSRPPSPSLSAGAGTTVTSTAVTTPGTGGQLTLTNDSGSTDAAVDVVGWFPAGSALTPVSPSAKLLTTSLGANKTTTFPVLGRGGVPSDAASVAAVAFSVTVTTPTTPTSLTLFPSGTSRPASASMTTTRASTTALVVSALGTSGLASLHNLAGTTVVSVDVVGWFPTGSSIVTVGSPRRLLDTRPGGVTVDGESAPGTKLGPADPLTLRVAGRAGVPSTGVAAVALTVTAAAPSAATTLTVYPSGETRPTASSLTTAKATVSNLVISKVGADGRVVIYNAAGSTDVTADIVGWFGMGQPAPVEVTTSSLPEGSRGASYTAALFAAGGSSPFVWSLASGSLPAGLSIDPAGRITGAPTATGTATFSVRVGDSLGSSVTRSLTITTAPRLLVSAASLPGGRVGEAYNTMLGATGGRTPYTWSIDGGTLPAGLALSPSGMISGTPSAAGASSFAVRVKDASGRQATRTLGLTIASAIESLRITTTALPTGTRGSSYTASLAATGGVAPYSWSVTSGQLPPGISLSTSGALSGTPTTAGTSSATFQVLDSQTRRATASLSITVDPLDAGFDHCGTLTVSETWHNDKVNRLTCDVTVGAGVTLTLEPGTIVKSLGHVLAVRGTLAGEGTADQPIAFTSLDDDTIGGDTNGDGSATVPGTGDWPGITVTGGSLTLRQTSVRWGRLATTAAGAVTVTDVGIQDSPVTLDVAGPLTVARARIDTAPSAYTDGVQALTVTGATGAPITVTNSTIVSQYGVRITARGPTTVQGNSITGLSTGLILNPLGPATDAYALALDARDATTADASSNTLDCGSGTRHTLAAGLLLQSSATPGRQATAANNTITNCRNGLTIAGTALDPKNYGGNVGSALVVPTNALVGTVGADISLPSAPGPLGFAPAGLLVPDGRTLTIAAGGRVRSLGPLRVEGTLATNGTATSESRIDGDVTVVTTAGRAANLHDLFLSDGNLTISGPGGATVQRVRQTNTPPLSASGIRVTSGGPITIEDVTLQGPGCLVATETTAGQAVALRRIDAAGASATVCTYEVTVDTTATGVPAPVVEDVTVHDATAAGLRVVGGSIDPAKIVRVSARATKQNVLRLGGSIIGDLSLPRTDVPVVGEDLTVTPGASLRMNAGAVLKMVGALHLRGALVARGNPDSPAVITASTDDTVGGDTNGDGSSSFPRRASWLGIDVADPDRTDALAPSIDAESLELRWAGVQGADARQVRLVHSKVTDSQGVAVARAGSVDIEDSTIARTTDALAFGATGGGDALHFDAPSGAVLIARNTVADITQSAEAVGAGVWVTGSAGQPVTVQDNFIQRAEFAVRVDADIDGARLTGNSASGVQQPILRLSGRLVADLSVPGSTLPLVVDNAGLIVPSGRTMTVTPGQTVKLLGRLDVSGALRAAGSPGHPVTFTSFSDDSSGGDTNGDGSSTHPATHDWPGIRLLPGSSADLQEVRIRYADVGVASQTPNTVTIRGEVTGNGYGVTACDTTCVVDARYVWWGNQSGPAPYGTGDRINGNVIAWDPQLGRGLDLATSYALDPYVGFVSDVNPVLGSFSHADQDVSVATPGPSLRLSRSYDSGNTRTDGFFGRGWRSSYETRLDLPPDTTVAGVTVTVTEPEGRQGAFTRQGSAWLPPAGSRSTLVQTTAGWTYTNESDVAYQFTGTRLVRLQDRMGRGISFSYNDSGQLVTLTADGGRAVTLTWSGRHVATVSTAPVGTQGGALTWHYSYTGDNLTQACNPLSDRGSLGCTTFEYTNDRMSKIVKPRGNADVSISYTPDGKVSTKSNGVGDRTTFRYLPPRTVEITDPRGGRTTNDYDENLHLVRTTDALGNTTSYEYDATTGMRTATIDPLGHTVRDTYDTRGNRTSNTDAEGYTEYYEYSPGNDLLSVRGRRSAGPTDDTYKTSYQYDGAGNRLLDRSPALPGFSQGVTSGRTFSVGTEDGVGGGTIPAGLVLTETDPRGATTRYAYDRFGDERRVDFPSGKRSESTYDELGRRLSTTEFTDTYPAGRTTTYTYDALGRLIGNVHPSTKNAVTGQAHQLAESLEIDPNGNVITSRQTDVATGETRAATNTYDQADRLTATTDAEGGTSQIAYDLLGNVATLTDGDGRRAQMSYDADNHRKSVTTLGVVVSPGNPSVTHDVTTETNVYDGAGRLIAQTDGIGATHVFAYDNNGQALSETVANPPPTDGSTPGSPVLVGKLTLDADRNVVASQDGNGITSSFQFDAADQQVGATFDPGGLARRMTVTHDAGGNVVQSSMSDSTRTETQQTVFDAAGRQVSQSANTGTELLTSRFSSDADGHRLTTTDPRGTTTGTSDPAYTASVDYNELGRPVRVVGAPVTVEQGGVASTVRPTSVAGYDAFGNVTEQRDATGAVTAFAYDRLNRLVTTTYPTVTNPDGSSIAPTEQNTYDHAGNVTAKIDRRAQRWEFQYDALSRVIVATQPAVNGGVAGRTLTTYDDASNRVSTVDPLGATTQMTYDGRHQVLSRTQLVRTPQGTSTYVWRFDYDNVGNLTKTTDPSGNAELRTYDHANNPLSTVDSDGLRRVRTFDLQNRVLTEDDGDAITTTTRDLAGRVTGQRISGFGQLDSTVHFDLDKVGNVIGRTSQEGRRTTWTYDAGNRLQAASVYPSPTETITSTYGRDAEGRITRLTDGNGNSTLTTFNGWGLPTQVVEPSTPRHPQLADRTWTTNYNTSGDPVTVTEPGGVRLSFTYDSLGRATQRSGSGTGVSSVTETMTWDAVGQLTAMSAPGGTQTFDYDDRGLLLRSGGPEGASSFTYDPASRLTSRVDAAGTSTFTWDAHNRLSTLRDAITGATKAYDYSATSSTANRPSQVTTTLNGRTSYEFHDYNAFGEQTSVEIADITGGTYTQTGSESRSYDGDGLLTDAFVDAPGNPAQGHYTYDHDGAGRLTAWAKAGTSAVNYVWDKAGNLINRGGTALTYDRRNRLVTENGAAVSVNARGDRLMSETGISLGYDALGRTTQLGSTTVSYDALGRIGKQGTKSFLYAGTAQMPSNDGSASYSQAPNETLISVGSGAAAELVVENGHGDPAFAFKPGGSLDTSTMYDPLGRVVGAVDVPGSVGFDGGWTDSATGNTLLGSRWYAPDTGGFTSRDRIAGDEQNPSSLNRYIFGFSDAVDHTDPAGTWPSFLSNAWHAVTTAVTYVAKAVVNFVAPIIRAVVNAVQAVISPVVQAVRSFGQAVYRGVTQFAAAVTQAATTFVSAAVQRVERTVEQIAAACTDKNTLCGKLTTVVVEAGKVVAPVLASAAGCASSPVACVQRNAQTILSVGAGLVVGIGCTIATGGAGAIACAALGGAVSGAVDAAYECKTAKCFAEHVALGALTGAAFGGAGKGLSKLIGKVAPDLMPAIRETGKGALGRGFAPLRGPAEAPSSNLLRVPLDAATASSGKRLAQDVAVSPIAPNALGLGRSIGRASHNQALQADIAALPRGATGIRVNQQQVNGLGQRVGINRPDLQYSLNGERYYVEYEGLANPRGALHEARILANDPGSNFILRLVP